MTNNFLTYSDRLNYAIKLAKDTFDPKMSQSKLARAIGVTPQTVQYLCSNQREQNKGSKYTGQLAKILRVDSHWLETGQGEYALLEVKEEPAEYSPLLNKMAVKDTITFIRYIEHKVEAELSIEEWTTLFTHFYEKYDASYKKGIKVDKTELALDFHSLMDELKSTKSTIKS